MKPKRNFFPEDFGAVGDGLTDDTIPLQAAMDAAAATSGTLRLSRRKYVITQPLHTRKGKFTVRGDGWYTNVSELYDSAGDQYAGYRNSPLETTPASHVSGSVIYAINCHGFVRDDGGHDYFRAQGFALVGSATSPRAAFQFGDRSLYNSATENNIYKDVGVFHWDVGFDCSMQYRANYFACTARGCKDAIRLGNPHDGLNGSGGGPVSFYGIDLQSNDRCIALYEGQRIAVTGCIAQGHKDFLYIRPNGNNVISGVVVRDVYLESTKDPNCLLVLASSPTNNSPQTAQHVSLENINVQGSMGDRLSL